jgi:HSP20 family protein
MAMHRRDFMREPVSFRDAVDRIVRQNIVGPAADLVTQMVRSLPLDVSETDQAFVLEASLPGFAPNEVDITLQGDMLRIHAERVRSELPGDRHWLLRERRMVALERSIELPARVNAERAEARFDNGVLVLTLPKTDPVAPQRITVSGADATRGADAGSVPTQAQPTFPAEQDRLAPVHENESEDPITEASKESFPASDPPTATSERNFR